MPIPDSDQNVTKRISLNYWIFYLSRFKLVHWQSC
jgi:hypothetical protein